MLLKKEYLWITFLYILFQIRLINGIEIISKLLGFDDFYDDLSMWNDDPDFEMMDYVEKVNWKIERIDNTIKDIKQSNWIKEFLRSFPTIKPHLDDIESKKSEINIQWKQMRELSNNYLCNSKDVLIQFADKYRQLGDKMDNLLRSISDSFLKIWNIGKSRISESQTKVSLQQFLHSSYVDISLTELKTFLSQQLSCRISYDLKNEKGACRMNDIIETFNARGRNLFNSVIKQIGNTDSIIWKKDPVTHIREETYDEVTRLRQGYLIREDDLTTGSTCWGGCEDYTEVTNQRCEHEQCTKQPQRKCEGKLWYCEHRPRDFHEVCLAEKNSIRRYEYTIEHGVATGYPKCKNELRILDGGKLFTCESCLCICDEQGPKSDRFFNLGEVGSNINENMVVTGIRWKKHNRIFHLQIQEGQLEEAGHINPNTLRWVPLNNYKITDAGIKSGTHYHTLSWKSRLITLDDLNVKNSKSLITGVRFTLGPYKDKQILNLEIRTTKFNYANGELDTKTTKWESNNYSGRNQNNEIRMTNPDRPNKNTDSQPNFTPNRFIEFTHSDRVKDLAQLTVPFIDIQEVTTNPPVPLSGVGIYYKGRRGYGGFIAPKLMPFKLSSYI